MTTWRWDQGRVLYFQFDVLREIAKVLVTFEGKDINDNSTNDELKKSLMSHVGLPFAPDNYKINRNYSRVFQCALLAYLQGKSLYVSDICKLLASDESYLSNCDNYMCEVIRRFRFPFPAFNELDDMVGLCPSCHKAIHDYYRKWLKANNQDDFRSKQEAMSVYLEAVREIA